MPKESRGTPDNRPFRFQPSEKLQFYKACPPTAGAWGILSKVSFVLTIGNEDEEWSGVSLNQFSGRHGNL